MGTRRRVSWRRTVLPLVLALAAVAARPSPVASGPRPAVPIGDGLADPWSPPTMHADERFSTLPYRAADGRTGTWVISDQRLPLQVVIEQELVARFGFERIRDALTVWNGVGGSRFAIEVRGTTDTGADRKRRDGVSRVFLDRTDCDGDYLARAHLYSGDVVEREGRVTNYVWEADIGICERMGPDRLAAVLRHEVAHVAGLGHLCDPGEPCHVAAMGQDNRCRVMYPAAYRCQAPSVGDSLGLIHLYPRLPRIATDDPPFGHAAASRYLHARHRSTSEAVLVAEGAEPRLQVEAAHLAGLRGGPVLTVGSDCTEGIGGRELNRVLAVTATVTLVGDLDEACASALRDGWEVDVERLADARAVTVAVREHLGEPTTAFVVSEDDRALADAVVALPAALNRGALLLRGDRSGLTEHARDLLQATRSIERVIILGHPVLTPRQVESDVIDLGLAHERISTGNRALTALGTWLDPAFFGQPPHQVLLTTDDQASLLTTASLAAGLRWPVLLTPGDTLDGRVASSLAASATGGLVVGSETALTPEVQLRASRAVG